MQYTVRLSACRTCSGAVRLTSPRRVNITSNTNSTTHVRDNLPIDARSIGRVYSELLQRLQRLQQLQLDLSTSASTSGLTAATCRVCDLHRTSFCSPTCSSTSGLNHGEIIDDKLTWTSTSSYMYEYEFLHQIHVLERSTRAEYRVPDLMANLVHSGRDTFWPFSRRVRPRSYN